MLCSSLWFLADGWISGPDIQALAVRAEPVEAFANQLACGDFDKLSPNGQAKGVGLRDFDKLSPNGVGWVYAPAGPCLTQFTQFTIQQSLSTQRHGK